MQSEASSTCAGACCSVFYFPHLAPFLAKWAESAVSRDNQYIADMLIPLANDEAVARFARLGYGDLMALPQWAAALNEGEGHLFTCRHWNEETRLCGAYEARPQMCSDYPYGGECSHGCSYVAPLEVRERWLKPYIWEWKKWRWSSKRGGYSPVRRESPAADWVPGTGWTWDGHWLLPTSSTSDWDHTTRRWREKEKADAAPIS